MTGATARGGGPRRSAAALVLALVALGGPPAAQDREEREPVDPYTEGDPEVLAALGYERFGPFAWSPTATTETVARTLGGVPLLWVETEHFVLGSSLERIGLPDERDERKRVQEELKELAETLPNLKRPKELDPWLRLHLAAFRVERAYRDFLEAFGVRDDEFQAPPGSRPSLGEGPHMGLRSKFQVLLLEKNSTLARYTAAHCGGPQENLYRYYDQEADQLFLGLSTELVEEPFRSEAMVAWILAFGLNQNFANGFRGFTARERGWFSLGIARWFARRVDDGVLLFTVPEGAATRLEEDDAEFERKVRARVEHEFYPTMEEILGWDDPSALKLADHAMLWSRIDFVMAQPVEVRRRFLVTAKEPVPWSTREPREELVEAQYRRAIEGVTGTDLAGFDAAWAEYVLESYRGR